MMWVLRRANELLKPPVPPLCLIGGELDSCVVHAERLGDSVCDLHVCRKVVLDWIVDFTEADLLSKVALLQAT